MAQEVDPDIWSACGGQVTLGPATSEKCVFIPQGLIEQCTSSEEVRLLCSRLPCVACSVLSIQYLADAITDEVYAKVVIKYDPLLDTPAPADSRQATIPASNTPSPVAPGPSTMQAANTSSPVAPGPSTMQAADTQAPAASRPETLPATNTRASTASNTSSPLAPRPSTMQASKTRAPAASGPVTMAAINTRAPAASNTSSPLAPRPPTMQASNCPSPVARGQSNVHASTLPASKTQAPTASTLATIPAASTPSHVASRLTILRGFIKVLDANDLISQECTITAASLGVGAVLPKEKVSLQIRDIHGRVWLFEHRYNQILERHSLADGWKLFLDNKKLCPGDSLVFLKKDGGLLTVGIRRAPRKSSGLFNMGEPLSRVGSGSPSIEELAVILGEPCYDKASLDRIFKFDYFPSVHSSWFLVPVAGLQEKIQIRWCAGMRVRKLAMVTDQLKQVYIQGIVTGGRVVWKRAFWKALDVKWDHTYGEREAATNMWEVEPVAEETTEPLPEEETTRPSKRLCIRQ